MNPKWTWPKIQLLCRKTILVFATRFVASFCLSGLMLVDYPDYIENKRHQIVRLSEFLKHDLGQTLEAEIAVRGERGCSREWDDVKDYLSDFAGFVSVACGLFLLLFAVERVLVSKRYPYICVDYRWLKGNKHAGWIIFAGMLVLSGTVYAVMVVASRCMLDYLMWPGIADAAAADSSTRCRQLLSAWDQLLACDKWLVVVYCVFGLFAVLAIVVWLFANVRYVKTTPAHTPCP